MAPFFDDVRQDVRFAVRTLRKSPGFTIVAVLVLAIGIGGNTAIYSLVDAMFVRGLPYQESDRLMVLIGNVERAAGVERRGGSYPDFADWRAQSKNFEGLAIYSPASTTLTAGAEPERVAFEAVSAAYFDLLRVKPQIGRAFRPDEDEVPGRNLVVILSDGLWKRRFGGDRNVTNQTVLLGTRTFQVVGVAPPGFRGLSDQAELFLPYLASAGNGNRGSRGFNVIARLKPGVERQQAQAELDAISKQLAVAYPDTNDKRAVEVSPLSVETFGQFQPVMTTLMIAVGFVLLIACLNVANLLISRSEARQREIAVRAALGAGQLRLARQLVTESCVLALAGAVAGLAVTELAIRGLVAASPIALPSFTQPALNLPVLLFTMACAIGCGVLLGLAPVLHTRIAKLADALKSASRGSSGARTARTRSTLVVVEVALAVVLLVGAGLMIRSVQKLAALEPGFNPDRLLALSVNIPAVPSVAAPIASAQPAPPPVPPPLVVSSADLLERIRAVPGVASASLVSDVPLAGLDSAVFYTAEGDATADATTVPRGYVHGVWPGFFETMGIAMKSGREFSQGDMTGDRNTVIVSENVARRFWPGQVAVGRRIKQGTPASTNPWLTIVGVVGEVKYRGLPENPTADPDLYFPFFDRRPGQSLVIRSASGAPDDLAPAVRDAIRALHPRIVIYNVSTLDTLIAAQTAPSTFTTWLLTIFAGISLVLSVVGIYGVMSHLAAQRSREFGIRMALGARRSEIVGLVLRNGSRLVVLGAAIGLIASLAVTRVLGTLLFQVTAVDPASVMAVAAIMLVAIAACCVPALRAARVDPIKTLRIE